MFDYLAFVYAGKSRPSGNARKDGKDLAAQCVKKLKDIGNEDRFPPKLLILLASPAYLNKQKAVQLLIGVNSTFSKTHKNVPLIGSSVAAVFFDRQVHSNGAVLMCLASTLIEAEVACGKNARRKPEAAIKKLLKDLELDRSKQIDPNPLANRLMLAFMPGCNQSAASGNLYPAPDLQRLLYEGVQARIWMIGGVSSANDLTRKQDGFQFAQGEVLRDSVVAASITTGVPIGVSLNDGLISSKKVFKVTKLGADKRTILELDKKAPVDQLAFAYGNAMLAKLSADDERTVDIPLPMPDGSVQMLRPHKKGEYLQVFRPGGQIVNIALKGIKQARRRVYVKRPIASLIFACKAYNPRDDRGTLEAKNVLTGIEKVLQGDTQHDRPCIGGFFDGEIGVDEKGRSRLTNGGVGYVIFGDEIRERTPLYQGVSALATYGHKLLASASLTPASIYENISNALNLINKAGFPGAMLSLIVSNLDRELSEKRRYIIARETIGRRFAKIKEHTKRRAEGKDVLALVARENEPRFIPDSTRDRFCNQEAIELAGLISQYILPLKRLDKSVFGTLQVDLGDLRHLSPAAFRKTEKARMLDCLAEVISASINRIASAVENAIKLELDKALAESLSANTVHDGVEKFFRAAGIAFGVQMGHLRLVENKSQQQTLVLETGFGAGYEAEKYKRHEIDADDSSPICCAFGSAEPHIVNDVSQDPAFQTMLQSVVDDPTLHGPLSQTKSYAAVSFLNEEGNQMGAFSFGSTEPWFFLKLHRAALVALSERLGFLIQHLKAKIARDFLLRVSPKLAERNLNEEQRIFNNITNDFRAALRAEFASLYLWDDDTDRYVLRAQSKWKDNRWVHAANYDHQSAWLGVTAINKEPLYVPDLRKFYEEQKYQFSHGRYARYIFGQPLSKNFAVEAIGLPLRIGPDKESKFGVLTLYRRIKEGQRTGFVTTNIQLLQEGAYNAAGLINAVMWHRLDKWEKQEQDRRNRVYQGLNLDEGEAFEKKICREVAKAFGAAEVDFYRVDRRTKIVIYSCIAGYRSDRRSEKLETTRNESDDHLELLESAFGSNSKNNYQVAIRRRELTDEQRADPALLKTEGLVEQVCVPLVGDKKHIASLVVRWRVGPALAFSLTAKHDDYHLQVLGRILGSAYSKYIINKRAERSNQAVQTAGLYVFQHAHKLINAFQILYRLSQFASIAKDEKDRKEQIKALEATAVGYIDELDWVFDLGETIQDPATETIPLAPFLEKCWRDISREGRSIDKVQFPSAEETTIIADPKLIKEVFFNLMNNAIDATNEQKEKTGRKSQLIVSAVVSEDKETVKIIFKDNGIGMTPKQKEDAIRGFKPTGRQFRKSDRSQIFKRVKHKGVGVLISRFLLGVQNGHLDYVSKRGKGTQAVVTLPNFPVERRRDEVAKTD
jgi:hypothetical protein